MEKQPNKRKTFDFSDIADKESAGLKNGSTISAISVFSVDAKENLSAIRNKKQKIADNPSSPIKEIDKEAVKDKLKNFQFMSDSQLIKEGLMKDNNSLKSKKLKKENKTKTTKEEKGKDGENEENEENEENKEGKGDKEDKEDNSKKKNSKNKVRAKAKTKAKEKSKSKSRSKDKAETAKKKKDEYNAYWLKPENRMDKYKRRPNHPEYDPRTCYVPPVCYTNMFTPAQEQYWKLKSENMDVLLLFKIGKFYEMFDDDAHIGVKELGLTYMKNHTRVHAGFPEMAYSKNAKQLIRLGYRVGRVEQTETPEELKQAKQKGEKRDVVHRNICNILTAGNSRDPDIMDCNDCQWILSVIEQTEITRFGPYCHNNNSLSAQDKKDTKISNITPNKPPNITPTITHDRITKSNVFVEADVDKTMNGIEYGVCLVNTSTGTFEVGQFTDDRYQSFLKILITQTSPAEVIYKRDHMSLATKMTLRNTLPSRAVYTRLEKHEYWDDKQTIEELHRGHYWAKDDNGDDDNDDNDDDDGKNANQKHKKSFGNWPKTILMLKDAKKTLALSALGGCISYLRRLMVDKELLSVGRINTYDPQSSLKNYLVLDSQTLRNLDVLDTSEGNSKGSLLDHIDYCGTLFGKRLLSSWITRPLTNIALINTRFDAVENFINDQELLEKVCSAFKKTPDLEKNLLAIYSIGLKRKINAVMFTNTNTPKLQLFLLTLNSLENLSHFIVSLRKEYFSADNTKDSKDFKDTPTEETTKKIIKSKRLKYLCMQAFPEDLIKKLLLIKNGFDHVLALEQGYIVPFPGLDDDYDAAEKKVKAAEKSFDEYLEEQRKFFDSRFIKYVHKGKERYQLEIYDSVIARVVGRLSDTYQHMSSAKNVKRYWTPKIEKMTKVLDEAKEEKSTILKNVTQRTFSRFCQDYDKWVNTVKFMAELDCLASLALASKNGDYPKCRPVFISKENQSLLELKNVVHPSLVGNGGDFIPNDILMGTKEQNKRFSIISGPNMGGKSTLLRQTCSAVILAQIGCYVPAESCTMTIFDRIFTRIGANDRIMQSQSTFLIELEETSVILRNATRRSLVILDELGRGTSTFDGCAIAHAVVQYLSKRTDCITLFSTHYHMLSDDFRFDEKISLNHMAAEVDEEKENITFLYKFSRGACPKSYGMNVAKLAGLPKNIVLKAKRISDCFEKHFCTNEKEIYQDKINQTLLEEINKKEINIEKLQNLQLLIKNNL